tara:strand:- start:113 stop:505 length:393 start_codon:yes stop_codon:yes gene_type:complete
MRNHRNIRRNKFRNNDRDYRQNGSKIFKSNPNNNFQRRIPGKNNHNAPRLIEKYNDLAREALSNGDKILSENYYQHADHFLRVSLEQSSSNSISQKNYTNQNILKDSNVQVLPKKDPEKIDQNSNTETKE